MDRAHCLTLWLCLSLIAVAVSLNVQTGNNFPGGVKIGFDGSKPCNEANTGLLQFDPEGSGALQVCNGSDWLLAGAGANATVLSRSSSPSSGPENSTEIITLLEEILEKLRPSNQQDSIYCTGNGDFVPGVEDVADDRCECFDDDVRGHHEGVRCSECLSGWDYDSDGSCTVDIEPPVYVGASVITIEAGEPYNDEGVTFTDNSNFVLTLTSNRLSVLDVHSPGTYNVSYTATDGFDNSASVSLLLVVVDTEGPVISLSPSIAGETVSLSQYDETFSLPTASATDLIDGDRTGNLEIPALNTSIIGVREIVYSANDSSGNVGTTSFFVNVTDVDECTLPSNSPHTHLCDANATCTQNSQSGFYDCYCRTGYFGNGYECVYNPTPINPTYFSYTGGQQLYTVPSHVTRIQVKVWGAGGGGGDGSFGGAGGYAEGSLDVTPGDTYTIIVGGRGKFQGSTDYISGGYGGGGNAGNIVDGPGGSGGGLSGFFSGNGGISFSSVSQSRSLILSGGGSGGATYYNQYGGNAGAGGGLEGRTGSISSVYQTYGASIPSRKGYGGTQTAGGVGATQYAIGGINHHGGALKGGDGANYGGGGGGGGYYGGGGSSAYANGGGGSGYIHSSVIDGILTTGSSGTQSTPGVPPNTSDEDYISGIGSAGSLSGNGGHGLVVVRVWG